MATYLEPYVGEIKSRHARGENALTIAQAIYDKGLRSPHRREYWSPADEVNAFRAMVKYVITGGYKPKRRSARLHVWDPESQYAELELERI